MIIKSISLKDFQCYFGSHEENRLEFTSGINLVIGENAGGKSKLFDAFYWVLHDQIFHSDRREFVRTNIYREKIFSDKAKKQCSVGDQVSAEVVLKLVDSRGVKFRITRIYRAKRTDENSWAADDASKLLIEEYKTTKWQLVPSERHDSILDRVIPGHVKPYMWFQGEQVDSLMDFQSKSSLMQVINLLSDIGDYDKISEITQAGSERAAANYTKAANRLSRNQTDSNRLTKELASVKEDINKHEESKANNIRDRNMAQNKFDGLINQIDDAQRKAELKIERKNIEGEIEGASRSLERHVKGLNKKLFSEFWLLMKAQPIFDEYSTKYNQYYQAHLAKINAGKTRVFELPIDIPQPIHVSKMLDDEKCFVCGREAKTGSPEYAHIENLLSREKEETKDVFKSDCSLFFQNIYNNALQFKHSIVQTEKNIADEFKEIASLKSSLRENEHDLKSIDEQFDELLADDKSESIVKEFKIHKNNLDRYTKFVMDDEKALEALRTKSEHIQNQLDKLVVGNVDEVVAASRDIWKSLHQIALGTRAEVFSNLVSELEESANAIFRQMTEKNISITGRLKLKMLSDENCIPEIVDNEGAALHGSNDSNIILVKLALIMAVVTSRARWSTNYALISDAPTSKMAKNYSYGFYSALGENFQQSIVMTYDFLSEEDRETLRDFKMGNVHRIESIYPSGNREDRSDLSIKISRVSI